MTGRCVTVLGTVSIQDYIFRSNRLREAVGASWLVRDAFEGALAAAARDVGITLRDPEGFTGSPTTDGAVEVLYVGGGNAALVGPSPEVARELVYALTRALLDRAPGIRVAVGHGLVAAEGALARAYRAALGDLDACAGESPPGAPLLALPVMRRCPSTGHGANAMYLGRETLSLEAIRKREAVGTTEAPGPAWEAVARPFEATLGGRRFPLELAELGGSEGFSWIAVVHADGNGLGRALDDVVATHESSGDDARFIDEIRAFSKDVSRISRDAFADMVSALDGALATREDRFGLRQSDGVFPLRPVVLGGDDLTFVCDARLGIALAARWLRAFAGDYDACAGVAIVPAKYPFARAYEHAAALCAEAKRRRREAMARATMDVSRSWIDAEVVPPGASADLGRLRASRRNVPGLYRRPWCVDAGRDDLASLFKQINVVRSSAEGRGRWKALHAACLEGETAARAVVAQTRAYDPELMPDDAWQDPLAYFDALDLADFTNADFMRAVLS